jgi:dynein assembly factor 1
MSVLEKEKPQPEKDENGFRIITEDFCKKLCYYNGGYDSPKLNVNLYLHFQGFRKIQNLDNFTNLQVLYLENNSINKIEGLDKLINLTCLYLQNNYIKEIENLENNTKLSILNLSNNKIQSIPNISYLDKLENLYISKNSLSAIQNLEGLLNLKSLSLLDIQNNPFSVSPDDLIIFLNKLEKLKVLYLKGDITRLIPNYRRTLIVKIKNLTYLDDKPIKNEDKVGAEAYFKGGYQAEKEARIKYREENDKVIQIRKREKEMMEISFDERKKLALNSLQLEYNKRKNELETEKDELNKIYQENKGNKKGKSLYNYLSSIDYRIYENEEFKKEEEKLIQLTIAKRERTDQNDIFEYEDWMDDIIQINLLKHCFDFQRALIGIHAIFKQKNVKNYLLFSELDLRSRWTQLEFNKFRKNNDDTFYYLKKEEVYPEDILELMDGKKQEEIKKEIKEEKEEKDNKFGINIEEGNVDEDNKDALLIESHNEQKKQDLDELD